VIRRTATAAICACLLVGCVSPYRDFVEHEGWLEIRARNFTVVGNVDPAGLRALASDLALFDALVDKTLNAPAGDDPPQVRLFVFRSRQDARLFTGGYAGIMMPTASGYYAVQSMSDPGYSDVVRMTLFHEYTHAVLERNRRVPYPRWYDEGLAEFMGVTQFRRGLVLVGVPPQGRLRVLADPGPLPLRHLFADDEVARREVHRFYATSWAVVHYANTVGRAGPRLARYVERIARGDSWQDAYAASFDVPLEAFEAAVAEHVRKIRAGSQIEYSLPVAALEAAVDFTEQPVDGADVAYELGLLLREMYAGSEEANAYAVARKLFLQAAALDPGHARARAAAGWCEATRHRWSDAEALIAAAREQASAPATSPA